MAANLWADLAESESSSDHGQLVVVVRRRRGRPRAAAPAAIAVQPEPVDPLRVATLALLLLGSDVQLLIAKSVKIDRPIRRDPVFERVMLHTLGPKPRPMMPISAEVALTQVNRVRLLSDIAGMAAAVHHLSRMAVSSMAMALLAKCDAGDLHPVCALRYLVFDETPMAVGTKEKHTRGLVAQKGTTEQSKILNTEFQIGFMFREVQTGRYVFVHTEIPCPLQRLDRNTGDLIK